MMSDQEIEEMLDDQSKPKRGCFSRVIRYFLFAFLGCAVCTVALGIYGLSLEPQERTPATPQTVTTNEGRTFTVPGDAYTDGRDTAAAEPVTLNRINIWSSIERTTTNCTLEHAVPIDLTRMQYKDSESRYYFRLRAGSCSGWLPGDFLSTRAEGIIGDLFP